MKTISKQLLFAAAAAAAVAAAPTLWAADNVAAGADSARVNTDRVLVTDFSGRPPFKRQFRSRQDIADFARFEQTAVTPSGSTVRTVDFKGTPPFKRSFAFAEDVADFARFEETTSNPEIQRTRRGPPGKSISRR